MVGNTSEKIRLYWCQGWCQMFSDFSLPGAPPSLECKPTKKKPHRNNDYRNGEKRASHSVNGLIQRCVFHDTHINVQKTNKAKYQDNYQESNKYAHPNILVRSHSPRNCKRHDTRSVFPVSCIDTPIQVHASIFCGSF